MKALRVIWIFVVGGTGCLFNKVKKYWVALNIPSFADVVNEFINRIDNWTEESKKREQGKETSHTIFHGRGYMTRTQYEIAKLIGEPETPKKPFMSIMDTEQIKTCSTCCYADRGTCDNCYGVNGTTEISEYGYCKNWDKNKQPRPPRIA